MAPCVEFFEKGNSVIATSGGVGDGGTVGSSYNGTDVTYSPGGYEWSEE